MDQFTAYVHLGPTMFPQESPKPHCHVSLPDTPDRAPTRVWKKPMRDVPKKFKPEMLQKF